jgi:hypothetical protein
VFLAAAAPLAYSAGLRRVYDHGGGTGWSRAVDGGLRDRADDFVAQDHRGAQDGGADGAVTPVVDVGSADAAVRDAHNRFVRLRYGQFQPVQP